MQQPPVAASSSSLGSTEVPQGWGWIERQREGTRMAKFVEDRLRQEHYRSLLICGVCGQGKTTMVEQLAACSSQRFSNLPPMTENAASQNDPTPKNVTPILTPRFEFVKCAARKPAEIVALVIASLMEARDEATAKAAKKPRRVTNGGTRGRAAGHIAESHLSKEEAIASITKDAKTLVAAQAKLCDLLRKMEPSTTPMTFFILDEVDAADEARNGGSSNSSSGTGVLGALRAAFCDSREAAALTSMIVISNQKGFRALQESDLETITFEAYTVDQLKSIGASVLRELLVAQQQSSSSQPKVAAPKKKTQKGSTRKSKEIPSNSSLLQGEDLERLIQQTQIDCQKAIEYAAKITQRENGDARQMRSLLLRAMQQKSLQQLKDQVEDSEQIREAGVGAKRPRGSASGLADDNTTTPIRKTTAHVVALPKTDPKPLISISVSDMVALAPSSGQETVRRIMDLEPQCLYALCGCVITQNSRVAQQIQPVSALPLLDAFQESRRALEAVQLNNAFPSIESFRQALENLVCYNLLSQGTTNAEGANTKKGRGGKASSGTDKVDARLMTFALTIKPSDIQRALTQGKGAHFSVADHILRS